MENSDLINFYDARDLFNGVGNYDEEQDLSEGLKRLRACHHEEAVYVCSLFPDGPPESSEEARRVFKSQGDNPIALCYAGLVHFFDYERLERAANMGHHFAQGCIARRKTDRESFDWSIRAASNHDRAGLCWLGYCFEYGIGVAKDLMKAAAAFKESAELGYGKGMRGYALIAFEKSDPQRYLWLGRAAHRSTFNILFLEETVEQLSAHHKRQGNVPVLLMIGRMLKGYKYINADKKPAYYSYVAPFPL